MYTAPTPGSVSGDQTTDNSKTCLDDEAYAYPVHASYQPHQHLHQPLQHPAQPYHLQQQHPQHPHQQYQYQHQQQQQDQQHHHHQQQHLHPSSLVGNGQDRRQANLSTGSDLVQVTVEDLLISDQQDLHARNSFRKQQVTTHAANPFPGTTTTTMTATIVSQSLGSREPSPHPPSPVRAELVFDGHAANPSSGLLSSSQPHPVQVQQQQQQQYQSYPPPPASRTPPPPSIVGATTPTPPQPYHHAAGEGGLSHSQSYATHQSQFYPPQGQHQQPTKPASSTSSSSSSSSSSMGAKTLTAAQQREAEMDDLIQKGIELHEANQLVEAFGYFEKAAKGENPLGQLMYGLSLRHGWGCHPNPQKALTYLQKAAEYAMGELNELGPVKPGSLEPKRSHLLSSSNSSASSRREPSSGSTAGEEARQTLRRMGTMNRKMAIATARTELVMALFELGMSFMKGWGVTKDKTIGFNYFKIAADLGDADSQNEVALCYQDGIGTDKDMFQAAKYYRLAAKQGAGQIGNQWIWKAKYDQYCNAEAAAAQSVEKRQRSKSSAAAFRFTSASSSSTPLPPSSPSSSSSSASKHSLSGIAAGLASVTAATAGAASPTATRQSMMRSAPIALADADGSSSSSHHHSKSLNADEVPVSLMSQMNLAGDLITSTSHQYGTASSSSGEKKRHRWSLFPSSRSSAQTSSSAHPPMPSSPPRS
ncbi:hypothetical protein BGZ73_001897 [Actinomortierella ambigua]|nr:hypothetical protein BGZ73_001897 [Actinomortierella ambigua]